MIKSNSLSKLALYTSNLSKHQPLASGPHKQEVRTSCFAFLSHSAVGTGELDLRLSIRLRLRETGTLRS